MSRVNKAIELLEQGQPTYNTRIADPAEQTYEGGLKAAQTWADYIDYNMEMAPYDVYKLRDFMRGLVDGGPTKSSHRTPAVIVTMPLDARNEDVILANAWVIRQVLAAGVHGILQCHADTPEAIRALVECIRFPFQKIGVGEKLREGRRGHGGEAFAAKIWGVSVDEYLEKADLWPLNPDGELMLGLKVENKYGLANCEETVKVPGISYAELGPNDLAMSLGYQREEGARELSEMRTARQRVKAAAEANRIFYHESARPGNVIEKIKDGVLMISCHAAVDAAEIGRKYTGRAMPW